MAIQQKKTAFLDLVGQLRDVDLTDLATEEERLTKELDTVRMLRRVADQLQNGKKARAKPGTKKASGEPRKASTADLVQQYLTEHGASRVSAMSAAIGVSSPPIYEALKKIGAKARGDGSGLYDL